jgi:preprotein translocase subunit SecE
VTTKPDERHAVSDEREGAGSVVTQPVRPTGKRSRRGAVADDTETTSEAQEAASIEDEAKRKKKTKKGAKPPRRNPIAYVINYLREVIGELRKVIWPNRKQMVTYTAVVLVFLAFMVTLIGLVDLGVARLVMLVFG